MNTATPDRLDKQEVTKEIIFAEAEAMKRIYNEKKKALNLTQRELAHRLQVKPPSIFAYLNGQTPLNIKFASFFAEQLQVAIDEFSPRMALEYGKIIGKIDQESFRYPVLNINQLDNFKEEIKKIKIGTAQAQSYTSDLNLGDNGFWVRLDSEDMTSYNGGLSFSKGSLLLVNPDEKPRVNEFALLKISYNNEKISSIIDSIDKYVFRVMVGNGEQIEARAFNPNACTITVSDNNTHLVGKVVSALYPLEMLTL